MDTDLTADLGRRRTRAGRIAAVLLVLVAAAFVVLVAVDVVWVHGQSDQWRVWPTAAPPKIVFHDHDYRDRHVVPAAPGGTIKVGKTLGGAPILAAATYPPAPATVWVRDGGTVYAYALDDGS